MCRASCGRCTRRWAATSISSRSDTLLGIADSVAKRRLLADARCLILPVQWEEPFGLVLIEATASGTPVVAMRRGAIPEVVEDGFTGIICDDPRELPDALRRVTGIDPAACRRRVEKLFTVDQQISAYEGIYRAALKRRSPVHAGRIGAHINAPYRSKACPALAAKS